MNTTPSSGTRQSTSTYSPRKLRSSTNKRKHATRSSQPNNDTTVTARTKRPSSSARHKPAPRLAVKKAAGIAKTKKSAPAAILDVDAENKKPPHIQPASDVVGTRVDVVDDMKLAAIPHKTPPVHGKGASNSPVLKNSPSSPVDDSDRKMSPVAVQPENEDADDDDDESLDNLEEMLKKVSDAAEEDDDTQEEGKWVCSYCGHETSFEELVCGACKKKTTIGWVDTIVPLENKKKQCDNCLVFKDSPTAECKSCGPISNEEPTTLAPAVCQAPGTITARGFVFPTTRAPTPTSDEEYAPPTKKRRLN